MSSKFRLYSTDISATLTPENNNPLPSVLIIFDQDPLFGSYKVEAGNGRGSRIQTLDGAVIQDFGTSVKDGLISFSDTYCLREVTKNAIQTEYEKTDQQYFFTDGYECWKVQFSRNPAGFKAYRNLLFAYHNEIFFSYEMNLLIVSKEI